MYKENYNKINNNDTTKDFSSYGMLQCRNDIEETILSVINLALTFDGPPTLERSGAEHRRAVRFSRPWGKRGLVRKVELSLQERRRGRKKPSLRVRKDG